MIYNHDIRGVVCQIQNEKKIFMSQPRELCVSRVGYIQYNCEYANELNMAKP